MWEERQEAALLEWRHTSRHKANDSLAPGRVPFQMKEKGRMSFIYSHVFPTEADYPTHNSAP